MQIKIEVTDDWMKLTTLAYCLGFKRNDPRKKWNEKERREAARYVAETLIEQSINRKSLNE